MSLTLRMVFLDGPVETDSFPAVAERRLRVADLGEASRRCLELIARERLPRDRWAGGIVSDDAGTEVGQVSHAGVVYELRPKARDPHLAIHVPPGLSSDWRIKGMPVARIDADLPGHGKVALRLSEDASPPFKLIAESGDGFQVDGRPAYVNAVVTVEAGCARVHVAKSDLDWLGEDPDAGSEERLAQALGDALDAWLSEPGNGEALAAYVSRQALFRIDMPLMDLGSLDQAFEGSRREVLAAALSHLSLREALAGLGIPASRP